MENIRERFGILIRPTGRFETVQLGFECKDQPIESAVSKYFGAGIEYHKTADELHIYIERQGAQDEGCIKNEAASWLANTSLFGDVIVLPRKKNRGRTDGVVITDRVPPKSLDAHTMGAGVRLSCESRAVQL